MWCLPDDSSKAVITAAEQINSAHRKCHLRLPETAVLFFMSKGTDYLIEHYHTEEMAEPFPRFLNRCPIWTIRDLNLCFLDGGRGAPDAGVQALVEEAAHLLEPRAHYRVLLQRLPLDWTGGLSLDGIPLPGESIRRCMRGCGEAVLLGATLGSAVDGLIRRESLTRPALALAVNGCAAAMLEHALNGACRELSAQVEGEGLTLTGRFSPGYGDLPLTLQPALLERLHLLRCKESRHEKLEAGMEKYRETASYFKTHKLVVLNVLGITFAQRISLFLSTYFVYRAFGLQGVSAMTILLLQAAISISVDMLPLPGGMGISEKLFLTIFVLCKSHLDIVSSITSLFGSLDFCFDC